MSVKVNLMLVKCEILLFIDFNKLFLCLNSTVNTGVEKNKLEGDNMFNEDEAGGLEIIKKKQNTNFFLVVGVYQLCGEELGLVCDLQLGIFHI